MFERLALTLVAGAIAGVGPATAQSSQTDALTARLEALEERVNRLEGGDFPLAYVGEELQVNRYRIVFKGYEVRGVATECFLDVSYAGPKHPMKVENVHMVSNGEERWPTSYFQAFGREYQGDDFLVNPVETGTYPVSMIFEGLVPGETTVLISW